MKKFEVKNRETHLNFGLQLHFPINKTNNLNNLFVHFSPHTCKKKHSKQKSSKQTNDSNRNMLYNKII